MLDSRLIGNSENFASLFPSLSSVIRLIRRKRKTLGYIIKQRKPEEEEEEEGKRIIVGKDRRYSNAVVVASASAYCMYVRTATFL